MNKLNEILLSLFILALPAGVKGANIRPIETVSKVADKVLNDVKFYYNLKLADSSDYGDVRTLDFSRNFNSDGSAYALSTIICEEAREAKMQIVNYGKCKIFLNGEEIWRNEGMKEADFQLIEREFVLKGELSLSLKKGVNQILIKSASSDKAWKVYLRPRGFAFTLKGLKEVESSLSEYSDWLMIGTYSEFDKSEDVEREFIPGKMYGCSQAFTWIVPRKEIVAANAEIHQPWGEGYTAFNYHAGGLAMAMEILGQYSGEQRFTDYSRTYCDFYIEKRKYMKYQKDELNAFEAWDNKIYKGYLLDYTSAPLLPYAEVLLNTEKSERNPEYLTFFNETKDYILNEQTRTEKGNFCRINPQKHSVWVDDMYMGLPFLIQAARLSEDKEEQEKLIDDAVNQVFAFVDYVWDEDANLYQHAQFTENPVKMHHWSRGNAWGLWAITNILSYIPKQHPEYKRLLSHYKKHIESLVSYQDESGLWHNLLDHPESYLETSGTAIFTVCMIRGINNGWLNSKKYIPIVLKAWKGIESNIGSEGEVYGITVGTNCTTDINYYLDRETVVNDDHGLFPVIIAGVELENLIATKKIKY